jgi:DNA-binding transcriptional LysR family regulator
MHIETFKTFCDLVETGSFSKAAGLNYVSQSAVSQQVKGLEQRYNRQLIDRSNRKRVVPTEAGRLVYEVFKEMVARCGELEARLRAAGEEMAGTIRVATVYSIGLYQLPPYVKHFIKHHPQVKIHVEYGRTDKVYEACRNQMIDFGIVALPLRKPDLEVIPFGEEELVLVCNPSHPLVAEGAGGEISLRRLQGEEFVAFERDIPTRQTIDRILRRFRVSVRTVMEFDNIETIKRSVEVGNGMSILPRQAVTNELRAGLLVGLTFMEGTFTRPIGIIHRRGKRFSPATEAFLRLLTAVGSGSVVAEGFDRVGPGSLPSRPQTTDQTDQDEDGDRDSRDLPREDKVNVRQAGRIIEDLSHEREASNT